MYLKGKKMLCGSCKREDWEITGEKQPCRPHDQAKEEGVLQASELKFPLQPEGKTIVMQAAPLQPAERSPRRSSPFLKDCTLWYRPVPGQFLKNCSPWKDPCWGSSWRTAAHGRDPMLEQGKSVRREEQQSVTNWCQLNSPSPCTVQGGGGCRRTRSEDESNPNLLLNGSKIN